MGHPMGESKQGCLRVDSDLRPKGDVHPDKANSQSHIYLNGIRSRPCQTYETRFFTTKPRLASGWRRKFGPMALSAHIAVPGSLRRSGARLIALASTSCNDCRQQFTVTVGTLFERSKIPLGKWLMAIYLLSASKKGMSTRQLSRMLGVSVKSSWFMMHRIREAMREDKAGPLGGPNMVVEVDETWMGGKAKNRAFKEPRP